MSFLTPLFLLGLAALAVPVLIHLTQRERKSVVEFPSLMFLRKIPYESVQRRRIRDWLLLALRLAAIALIVTAFARPFLRGSDLAAAPGGARDIVVLLDRSYSMGYGDSWSRAQRAAAQAIETATPADRISLVLFADTAEVALRSTPDPSRAVAEINAASPGPGSTKYGPALKLAGQPARRIPAAAKGSGAGVRLPARRMAARRHASPAGRHDDHDGGRRRRVGREPGVDAGRPAAIARERAAGARHGHGGRAQSHRDRGH